MAKAKKRADGRYCAQIYLGRDENGKRQYKSVYAKSPAELKEKETAVRLQLGLNDCIPAAHSCEARCLGQGAELNSAPGCG